MTRNDPDPADSWWTRWNRAATAAVVVLLASVVPIPGGTSAGSSAPAPLDLGLTGPFHLVGYAVLAALATRGTGRSPGGLLFAAGLATAFGFGSELLQAPIPWRTFAWEDAVVNAVGAGIGTCAVAVADRCLRGRRRRGRRRSD